MHLPAELSAPTPSQPTLPSGLADAALALAEPPVGPPAVGLAVGDVAGRPLPVGLALAVDGAGGVADAALAPTRAVVGTGVHPGGRAGQTQNLGHIFRRWKKQNPDYCKKSALRVVCSRRNRFISNGTTKLAVFIFLKKVKATCCSSTL